MHTIHVCKFIAGYVLVYMQICNVFIVNNIVDMILKKKMAYQTGHTRVKENHNQKQLNSNRPSIKITFC